MHGRYALDCDAALGEIGDHGLAVVALRHAHRVDEPAAPLGAAVSARQDEAVRVALAGGSAADRAQALGVGGGHARARGEQLVRLLDLRDAERGLDVGHAVVEAEAVVVEPVHVDRAALVAGRAELRGLVGGARDDHAPLPRRELLVRIEGEGGEVAAGAELHAVGIDGAGRLARVLEHAEALRLGQRAQLGQRGRVAEDVDGQDAGGALPHRRCRSLGIEVQGHRVDVDRTRGVAPS